METTYVLGFEFRRPNGLLDRLKLILTGWTPTWHDGGWWQRRVPKQPTSEVPHT